MKDNKVFYTITTRDGTLLREGKLDMNLDTFLKSHTT